MERSRLILADRGRTPALVASTRAGEREDYHMNKLCINSVLEHMNTLERMKNKYDNRASDLYKQGNVDRAAKLDYKVELYDREICGIEYALRKLGSMTSTVAMLPSSGCVTRHTTYTYAWATANCCTKRTMPHTREPG